MSDLLFRIEHPAHAGEVRVHSGLDNRGLKRNVARTDITDGTVTARVEMETGISSGARPTSMR